MSSVYHKSKNKEAHVQFMVQDWPDDMKISKEAFAEYAKRIEEEDFEDDIRNLCSSLHLLVGARRDTIKKLRASAEYLDSVWIRCRITKSVGTSASVVGGSLTIAGGILTLTTAGLAAPLLIAGIATSSVGAATNIGTSLVERIINSKQVREMGEALTRDKELTLKIESQIENMRRYKDSDNLEILLDMTCDKLGRDHILVAILKSVYSSDVSGVVGISAQFISEDVHAKLTSVTESRVISDGIEETIVINSPQTDEAILGETPNKPDNTDAYPITNDTLDENVETNDTRGNEKKILVTNVDIPDNLLLPNPELKRALMNNVMVDIPATASHEKKSWTDLISEHCKPSDSELERSDQITTASFQESKLASDKPEDLYSELLRRERSLSCSDIGTILDDLKINLTKITFSLPDNLEALNIPVIETEMKKVNQNNKFFVIDPKIIDSHNEKHSIAKSDSQKESKVERLSESKSCESLLFIQEEALAGNNEIPDVKLGPEVQKDSICAQKGDIRLSKSDTNLVDDHTDATRLAAGSTAAVATTAAAAAAASGTKQVAKESLKYSPLGPDVFLETGKVVGQNTTRLAGQVIVGVSAAFLAWDVIDLGWTVADLVRKKGSNAGKILKDKADELDGALKETIENYSVEMMRD